MTISLVAALAQNGVIGINNELPWRLPDDMRHFARLTRGYTVLMGHKTYASLPDGARPLPHRTNLVVTRNATHAPPPCVAVSSPEAGIQWATRAGAQELFIIGGSSLYTHTLALADRLYLTEVQAEVAGNIYFPPFDRSEWLEISRIRHAADSRHTLAFHFVEYRRKG